MPRRRWAALVPLLLAAACTTGAEAGSTTTTTVAPAVEAAPTSAPPTTTTTVPSRPVHEPQWSPFASVGGIVLHHPSARVERIGFHQSNHEGARELEVLPTASSPVTLEGRDRLTSSRSAADVVVDPAFGIRSPVTGTVKRAGGYTLYCRHRDDFVVVAPDARPDWEVKLLHIDGVQVRAGQRVVAGQTVLASAPTRLPFASQVDDHTTDPAWPHVHIEVVDPSIPNLTAPGGGC